MVVGTDAGCHWRVLDDPRVRPRHCAFSTASDDGRPPVILQAMQGEVHLNGARVHGPTPVYAGDRVQVGATVLRIPAAAGQRPNQWADSYSGMPPTTSPGYQAGNTGGGPTIYTNWPGSW
jgi:predicted component of type VI protein secretion system